MGKPAARHARVEWLSAKTIEATPAARRSHYSDDPRHRSQTRYSSFAYRIVIARCRRGYPGAQNPPFGSDIRGQEV
jgi:hypothetical protein